jgi:hypothetical protein
MRKWCVVLALALAGCVKGSPVDLQMCEPVDTIQAGPYTAYVCVVRL